MRLAPALLGVPLLALTTISLGYALVPAACHAGSAWMIHALLAVSLLLGLTATGIAAATIRAEGEPFLPLVAAGIGAIFCLVMVTQWAVVLFIPPCMH